MDEPLRHRRTKGAATRMLDLTPPRHIPTLPIASIQPRVGNVRLTPKSGSRQYYLITSSARTDSPVRTLPARNRSRLGGHHELRSSRSFKNTERWSGFLGNSGKDSRNFAMTIGLVRRKNVLISASTSSVDMYALLGS